MKSDLETTKLTTIHMFIFMFLIFRNISIVEIYKKVFNFSFKQYNEKIRQNFLCFNCSCRKEVLSLNHNLTFDNLYYKRIIYFRNLVLLAELHKAENIDL